VKRAAWSSGRQVVRPRGSSAATIL
jgi:hypothetical protein